MREVTDGASGRFFLCALCRQQVLICSHCDRGQVYCAGDCRDQARGTRRRAQIEDPAHIQALRDQKRRAGSASVTDRLVHAAPASAELLLRAAQNGHSLQSTVAGLNRLLQRYGARELEDLAGFNACLAQAQALFPSDS